MTVTVSPARIAVGWISCLLLVVSSVDASPLSFKITGGLAWLDGGDLNSNIQGWKSYYSDRSLSPDNFSFDLAEIHFAREGGIEITYSLSPRWTIGLGLELHQANSGGTMSSSLELEESYSRTVDDFGTIVFSENRIQRPEYRFRGLPIVLTLYHHFPFSSRGNVFVGAGGGYHFGRLEYKENYQYDSDYTDDNSLSGSLLRYVDQYSSSGSYSEESRSDALGFHGQAGLEWKVSGRIHLVFEVVGRWVGFTGWTGDKRDRYSWEQTWGFWGANTDQGADETSSEGRLWMVGYQSDITGKSYPRLVFSDEEPRFASYQDVRLAKINGNGFSFRIGLKIGL